MDLLSAVKAPDFVTDEPDPDRKFYLKAKFETARELLNSPPDQAKLMADLLASMEEQGYTRESEMLQLWIVRKIFAGLAIGVMMKHHGDTQPYRGLGCKRTTCTTCDAAREIGLIR